MHTETIFVGLSGGVDSSIAAKLLIDSGHTVVGVFIKTWHPDFITCTEEADRLDAMRVAAHLDIPFLTFDAVDAYKFTVADYMIGEYAAGRTPNPDVMCNTHIKFGVFLDWALAHGADAVATGHYARISYRNEKPVLKRGVDPDKDQSYFLWTLGESELSHIRFPVGGLLKSEVRNIAKDAKIPVFDKRDSQGVCFLGEINMRDFLSHYIDVKPGNVLDESGNVIGEHEGAILYTLGERQGFTITKPSTLRNVQYVVAKDLVANTITVAPEHRTVAQKSETIPLKDIVLRTLNVSEPLLAQFRYRQKPFPVSLTLAEERCAMLTVLDGTVEYPPTGQSCVLYRGDECVGGGIIA